MSLIRYSCDCTESGYGYAARGYLRALEACGRDNKMVRVIPAVFWRGPEAAQAPENDWLYQKYLMNFDGKPDPETGINVVHVSPTHLGMFWAANWYNIACTTWETSKLPEGIYANCAGSKPRTVVQTLNECYDEVWVPTPRVRDVFVASGVTKSIVVIPHALLPELLDVDPRESRPEVGKLHPKIDDSGGRPCRFYCPGSWDMRKNPQAVLRAYYQTGWTIASPVELLLHTQDNTGAIQRDVEAIRAACPQPYDMPSMEPSNGRRSYNWMLEVHRIYDVLVTASHGEGFCLPALEALAMGNLVVGTREVLDHFEWAVNEGWVLPVDSTVGDIAVMPEAAGFELGQKWFEPRIDGDGASLIGQLRGALDIAQNGLLPGPECAAEARKRYSPAAIGQLVKERMDEAERVLAQTGW